MSDLNRTQMSAPPTIDPNRTLMGAPPSAVNTSIQATQTIKPIQCPVCRTFNPVGLMFCMECGLIFDRALPEDAFGAPKVLLPVLVDGEGKEYTLRPGEQVIGRQADIVVADERVSRRHARIVLNDTVVTVEDMQSTNGTKLDGTPLVPGNATPWTSGALSLGGLELTLSRPGAAAQTLMPSGGRTAAIPAAPTTRQAVARLVAATGEAYDLYEGENTLGRRAGNTVVIPDSFVSGAHARIDLSPGSASFTDVGSSNGSWIDAQKVEANQAYPLESGTGVRVGETQLTFEWVQTA